MKPEKEDPERGQAEKTSFFQTQAGGLTLAFLVIMAAFVIIMAGLGSESGGACTLGFALIAAAMLYSPVKVQILDRFKKGK